MTNAHTGADVTTHSFLGGNRATWVSGEYHADVVRTDDYDHGKRIWSWGLAWPGGLYLSDETEGIHVPDHEDDPLNVLATLAGFLSAWDEALAWEERYHQVSENGGLFPRACIPFRDVIDEFALWGYEHENPEEES